MRLANSFLTIFLAISCIFYLNCSYSFNQQSNDNMSKFKDTMLEFVEYMGQSTKQKTTDCMNAFGDKKFCDCLAEELPIGMSILEYVYVITLDAKQIQQVYLSNNKELMEKIMKIHSARDKCIMKFTQ